MDFRGVCINVIICILTDILLVSERERWEIHIKKVRILTWKKKKEEYLLENFEKYVIKNMKWQNHIWN